MRELGFSASVWNRQATSSAWRVNCGAYPAAGVGVLNHFVLDWPERTTDVTLAEDLETAKAAALIIIEASKPDWAT